MTNTSYEESARAVWSSDASRSGKWPGDMAACFGVLQRIATALESIDRRVNALDPEKRRLVREAARSAAGARVVQEAASAWALGLRLPKRLETRMCNAAIAYAAKFGEIGSPSDVAKFGVGSVRSFGRATRDSVLKILADNGAAS